MNNSIYADTKKIIYYIYKNYSIYLVFFFIFCLSIIILVLDDKVILKKVYIHFNIENSPFVIKEYNSDSGYLEDITTQRFIAFENEALSFFRKQHDKKIILNKLLKKQSFNKLLYYNLSPRTHYIEFLASQNFNNNSLKNLLKEYSKLYNESNMLYIIGYYKKKRNEIEYTPVEFKESEVFFKIENYIDYKIILLLFLFFLFNATIICIIKELIYENNK